MQTLFETEHYRIYRNEGLTYLKNGVVNQIETGQCNALLDKLFGLNEEEAEKVLNNALPDIKLVAIPEPIKKPIITLKRIDRHIYEITNGNKIRYMVKCKIKKRGKYKDYGRRFKELTEAYKFRMEIKGL